MLARRARSIRLSASDGALMSRAHRRKGFMECERGRWVLLSFVERDGGLLSDAFEDLGLKHGPSHQR
jgi:hypothetical protein